MRLSNRGQLELLRALTDRGAAMRATVLGFSMEPTLRDGDVLTVEPMFDRDPAIGEIVAFVQPETGQLHVHRVLERTPAGWLLRGDGSDEPDGVIPREAILGRVILVERGGRVVDAALSGGTPGVARRRLRAAERRMAWLFRRAWATLAGRDVTRRPPGGSSRSRE